MISIIIRREIVVNKLKMMFDCEVLDKERHIKNEFINVKEYKSQILINEVKASYNTTRQHSKKNNYKKLNNNIEEIISEKVGLIFDFFNKEMVYKSGKKIYIKIINIYNRIANPLMKIKNLSIKNNMKREKENKTDIVNNYIRNSALEDDNFKGVSKKESAKVFHFFSFKLSDFGDILKKKVLLFRDVNKFNKNNIDYKFRFKNSRVLKSIYSNMFKISNLKEYFFKQFESIDDYSP